MGWVLFLLGIGPLSLWAAGDGVRTVDVRRLTLEALQRPVEAVGGAVTDGNRTVLRTDAAVREGLHFLVALDLAPARRRAVARVDVSWIAPGESTPREVSLAAPAGGLGGPDLVVALTGSGDPGHEPVAWRLRMVDSAGGVVAERASFLWAQP